MFDKIKLSYNNRLRAAQKGDDGTAYATCAAAVANPDSDFSVMGLVSHPLDVASVGALIGCGIEFDSTENKYLITDHTAALRAVSRVVLEAGGGQITALAISGSYLYAGCNTLPAYIVKIDLVAKTVVDVLRLEAGENYVASLAVSPDGLRLYVGCAVSPGKIVTVTLSNFKWASALTLATGENNVYSLVVSDPYLYAGLATTAGKIVRINMGTGLAEGTTITLGAGENYIYAIAISAGYLYAVCYVSPAKLVRINLVTWAVDGATVTFAAGEDNARTLVASGDYLYAGCYTVAGKVVRIKISTWAIDGATITFGAGEDQILSLATSGDYVYAGCGVSPAKIVRIKISTWLIDGATTTFAAGENLAYALAISGDYLYTGCLTTPGLFITVKISTWAIDGATITCATGENDVRSLAVSGDYLYAGLYTSPGMIVRINILSGVVEGTPITLAAGENYIASLAVSGTYLYAGCLTTAGKIVRINMTTWEISGATITLGAGENSVGALIVSGTYLYAGCSVTPGKVVRINIASWAVDGATSTFSAGEGPIMALSTYGDYVYAGCYSVAGKVVRIKISTWAIDGATITFAAGENQVKGIATDGTYLYAGCDVSPGKIVRISLAGWAIDGATITLDAGENSIYAVVYSMLFLYAACTTYPAKIVRINTAAWVRDSVLTMGTDEYDARAMAISGDYLYAGLDISPGIISKIFLYDTFGLFERLQDADIGGGFTVRAGLQGVNEDSTRPAAYAADGHIAPRAKGLTNTIYKVRAHAPNLIADGGFESGVFLPVWVAGANWAIDSATEIEGQYSAKWDLGASNHLQQTITGKVEKGKTYRILFKAKSTTANPTVGAITVQAKQTGSNTDLDADMAGTTPAITTTATWFIIDMTPDFTTNDWYLKFLTDHTKANGATAVVMDEIYVYEKTEVNNLIMGFHNLVGKAGVIINAWKLSPLRSTATGDANNKTEIGNFTITTADVFEQALTSNYDPVMEFIVPATASWIAETGEMYLGDYWQVPKFVQGPIDPYRENADGLRTLKFTVRNLSPALRKTVIKALFEKFRDNEAIWAKWDTDPPVLMEASRGDREAPYSPYMVDVSMDLAERL